MDCDIKFENWNYDNLQSPLYANPYLYATLYDQALKDLATEITDLEMW